MGIEEARDVVSDARVSIVHGNADFGRTDQRQILNMGVLSACMGYNVGSTLKAILREHGLTRSDGRLSILGMRYLRALNNRGMAELVSFMIGRTDAT